MLRRRKKLMVVTAIMTSATQNAVSQLYCLATVLNGSPAIKAPTAGTEPKESKVSRELHRGSGRRDLTVCHQSHDSMRRATEM